MLYFIGDHERGRQVRGDRRGSDNLDIIRRGGLTAAEAARFADLIESTPTERRRVAALGHARPA